MHEFYYQARETHLTAVLWENFSALAADDWLPRLASAAGLRHLPTRVAACKWSYGWVRERPKRKILDIVVHYRESNGSEGVLVIEAKNLGSGLGSGKDLDPTYYLDIPELLEFERRSQIYLVDGEVMNECRRAVAAGTHDVGFLSWQSLAGIQVSSALQLPVSEGLRHFVAGAIQRQYLDFGVRPDFLAATYLADEPSREFLDAIPPKLRQSNEERQRALWRLDPRPGAA